MESYEALRNVGVMFVRNGSNYNTDYNISFVHFRDCAILDSESDVRWE